MGGKKHVQMELTTMGTKNVLLGGDVEGGKKPKQELSEIERLRNEIKVLRRFVDDQSSKDPSTESELKRIRDSVGNEALDDLGHGPTLKDMGKSLRNMVTTPSKSYAKFSSRRYRKKLGEKFESFDYDTPDNEFMSGILRDKGEVEREGRKKELFRWVYLFLIGTITGCIAYWMTFCVGRMVTVKWDNTWKLMQEGKTWEAYFYYMGWVIASLTGAAMLVVWAPESAGSGIPQVKAYLNGNQVPGILRMKTLIAKVVGISLCVTSGMPAGREGPMVHTGAILSAGLARGYSDYLPCLPGIYAGFDNTKDRRDFVSMGAAAGVAAAFNAPIGGILFSLEEVSSFWSPALTWRSFICAIIAAYTVNIFMAVNAGGFADQGLVLFGHTTEDDGTYAVWEVFVFMVIAVIGGLVGSAYVYINEHITMARKKFWAGKSPLWRVVEAWVVVGGMLTLFFWLPMLWPCKDVPSNDDMSHHTGFHGINPVQYNCQDDHRRLAASEIPSVYNEFATLLLTPQETTILQLYSRNTQGYFSITTLAVFTVFFFVCAVTAYGVAVPAGLFIPSMMIGAGFGRLIGELLHLAVPGKVDPGLYALVGASAILGGITRMTISLTVIMVEISNDINYLLPIMLALAISKAVGDKFTHSLYDVHMDLASIPYLEPDPPDVFDTLSAQDIMARNPVMIGVEPTMGEIEDALNNTHNTFPVVDTGVSGMNRFFCGSITRENLDKCLDTMKQDGKASIDISLAMDPQPFIVQSQLSLRRVLRLFRGMGLRHLIVVDSRQRVIGCITRKDFINAPSTVQSAIRDPKFVRSTREAMMRMERSTRIKGANANAPAKLKRSNSFVGVL